MARIQEYLPEENAAGPQGAAAPNLELSSAVGRGVETLGRDVTDASDRIYTRQYQMEQSLAAGSAIDARVNGYQEIQDRTQDGTWDTDKYKQQFRDWQQDEVQNYQTGPGQNSFMRQTDRVLGSMLVKGNRASQVVSKNNAMIGYQSNLNGLASATRLDPSSFQDNLHAAYEQTQDLVNNGLLPASHQALSNQQAEQTLSREAVLQTAHTDPAKAISMLQDKNFAPYVDPKEMDELYNKIQAAKTYQDNDVARAQVLKTKADKAVSEKYLSDNANAIATGKITPQQIMLDGPSQLDFSTRLAAAETAKRSQQLMQYTNPATMTAILNRMTLPKDDLNAITDPSQLYKEPGLSPNDIAKLTTQYFKTPQGAAQKQSENLMMKAIQDRVKSPIMGVPDTDYHTYVNNAMSQYQKAKTAAINAGEDPTTLTDPSSKNYFPNTVPKRSFSDILRSQSNPNPTQPMTIQTTPGIIPSQVGMPQQTTPALLPKPNTPQETRFQLKNGKTAVYDSNKKFLRYEGQ
ncbi:MAG: hypothetical protein ABI351_02355 [Herbaspirillum sp.]